MNNKQKTICGVGINDADYVTQKKEKVDGKWKMIWVCPYYVKWRGMITRCYSETVQEKQTTYKGCTVCDHWLTFSNFKDWMIKQDWQDKALDKDILFEGNKIYSPRTCVFVDRKVNSFITESNKSRGKYMMGVHWHKQVKKYQAGISNPKTGKYEYLGLYKTELEAHQAWFKRKQELCQTIDDHKVVAALYKRYLLDLDNA